MGLAASLQPESFLATAASSAQTTHFSAPETPLHTPDAHAWPAATGENAQLPLLHVSLVQSLPSSQSMLVVQPLHVAAAPKPTQIGAPAVQPSSFAVPTAVSRQRTH